MALTSLGLDPDTDPRFVKNGNSVLDALLSFAVTGGGFIHDDKSGGINGMSTEQAYYALAAYTRYINGRPALYDMRDVEIDAPYQSVIRIIDAIGTVTLSSGEAISAARSAYNAPDHCGTADGDQLRTLTAAEKKLVELQAPINAVKEKIDAIGTVTLSSKEAIEAARRAYNGLSATEKRYVTNYAVLTRAEAKLDS